MPSPLAKLVMYTLEVDKVGKKFYRKWIFRDVSFRLKAGESLLLRGPNGSGKSTLLRILAGQLSPSEGSVRFFRNDEPVPSPQMYQYLSWTGPYLDLYGDLNLSEAVKLHFRFKQCLLDKPDQVITELNLQKQKQKPLRTFSSGMIQRLKVGLALYADSPLLLLDEPGSNLDEENTTFILNKIREFQTDRILIFVSNNPGEFSSFERQLELKSRA